MDTKTQSILNTVNSIVNKQTNKIDIYEQFANHLENSLNYFEEKFQIELTEEEENALINAAISHILNKQESKQIDLNESTIKLINENSPEEVFCYIVEWLAGAASMLAKIGKGAAVDAVKKNIKNGVQTSANEPVDNSNRDDDTTSPFSTMKAQIDVANQLSQQQDPNFTGYVSEAKDESYLAKLIRLGRTAKQSQNRKGKRRRMGDEGRQSEPESTTDPLSTLYLQQKAAELPQQDPNFRDYLGEGTVKKKKKLFKIIFVDKGVKKKGTAVSHKGVMRIVHGKQVFKVFDENNRDVTSQFKSGKKNIKNDKK